MPVEDKQAVGAANEAPEAAEADQDLVTAPADPRPRPKVDEGEVAEDEASPAGAAAHRSGDPEAAKSALPGSRETAEES